MTENPDMKKSTHGKITNAQFITLLTRYQKKIYGIIRMLIPYRPHAEDVMQETALVMWQKKDDFVAGTDFAAWAIRIARFQVMKYCRKQKGSRLNFTDEALDKISLCQHDMASEVEERLRALDACLNKLKQEDRNLINLRYVQELKASGIAEKVNRSVDGIYKSFSRIHLTLYQCISRSLMAGERDGL